MLRRFLRARPSVARVDPIKRHMSLRTCYLALVVVVVLAGCGSGSGSSKTATAPATASAPAGANTSSTASPPTPSASTQLASPQYRKWFIYEEETRHHRSRANAMTFIDCLVPMWTELTGV